MGWLDGLGGALVAGVGSLVGGAMNNSAKKQAASDATAASALEAQKNRDWQEQMSNTAYQRATADMKAAGLNPMLAYTQGGASSPGGATGTAFQAQPEEYVGKATQAGVSTAMAAERLKADVDVAKEQVPNVKADTALKQQSRNTLISQQVKADAETNNVDQNTTNARLTEKILQENLYSAQRAAEVDRQVTDFFKSKDGQLMLRLGTAAKTISPFIGGLSGVKGLLNGK